MFRLIIDTYNPESCIKTIILALKWYDIHIAQYKLFLYNNTTTVYSTIK